MLIGGIVIQALAESFISPRYLEFFSLQAPKGKRDSIWVSGICTPSSRRSWALASPAYSLEAYCPDPKTLTPEQALTAYDQANYIWFYFAAIGLVSALALYIYAAVTKRMDAREA